MRGRTMPVPKDKEKLYGQIVGHNINSGKSFSKAKAIADKAIGLTPSHIGGVKTRDTGPTTQEKAAMSEPTTTPEKAYHGDNGKKPEDSSSKPPTEKSKHTGQEGWNTSKPTTDRGLV